MKDPLARLNIKVRNEQPLRPTEATKINRWYPQFDLSGFTVVDLAADMRTWLSRQNINDGNPASCSECALGLMYRSYGLPALIIPSVKLAKLIDLKNKRIIRGGLRQTTIDIAALNDTGGRTAPQWIELLEVSPSLQLGAQPLGRGHGEPRNKRRSRKALGLRNVHGKPTGGVFKVREPNVRYKKVR